MFLSEAVRNKTVFSRLGVFVFKETGTDWGNFNLFRLDKHLEGTSVNAFNTFGEGGFLSFPMATIEESNFETSWNTYGSKLPFKTFVVSVHNSSCTFIVALTIEGNIFTRSSSNAGNVVSFSSPFVDSFVNLVKGIGSLNSKVVNCGHFINPSVFPTISNVTFLSNGSDEISFFVVGLGFGVGFESVILVTEVYSVGFVPSKDIVTIESSSVILSSTTVVVSSSGIDFSVKFGECHVATFEAVKPSMT